MKKKYIIIILVLVLLDQISKLIVINRFNVNDSLVLIDNFLKFCYIKNTGISFGMLSGSGIIIIILSLLIIGYMIYEFIKSDNKILLFSSSLIISGAFGNLIDRIFRGYVIDFISFTLFKNEMPIFNIADIFITFGVGIYLVFLFMEGKNERVSSGK